MSNKTAGSYIAALGAASPPLALSQAAAEDFLSGHYDELLSEDGKNVMHKIFSHPGIKQRYFAFNDPDCLINEDPDARIERFTQWGVDLAKQSIEQALDKAKIEPNEVAALIVNTCTGYICPGLSTYLIEELGLSETVLAFDLVGSGCAGAIPNLQMAMALMAQQNGGAVVSASVEICSATFQMGDDRSLIISNALFGDGAAAALLSNTPGNWAIVDSSSRHAPTHREAVRYVHKNGQLHNQLSNKLPLLVRNIAGEVVADLLGKNSLASEDVQHWTIHPGGEKILQIVQDDLQLSGEQLAPSRKILADYGNMSSATVWFILQDIEKTKPTSGEYCMMLAFGAGLSAHALLLQKC